MAIAGQKFGAMQLSRPEAKMNASASSPAGHRREEGDLAGAFDRRIERLVRLVDGGADDAHVGEGVCIALIAVPEPGDDIGDGGERGGKLDLFFPLADDLANPREIEKLGHFSRVTWPMPARK